MQIELNDALEHLLEGDHGGLDLVVEIEDIKWCNAEPDVGIMSDWVDDWSEYYSIDGDESGRDAEGFASALVALTDAYGDDEAAIAKAVRDHVNQQMQEAERD